MSAGIRWVYKCRACSEVFASGEPFKYADSKGFDGLLLQKPDTSTLVPVGSQGLYAGEAIPAAPIPQKLHSCTETRTGLADAVGYEEVSE